MQGIPKLCQLRSLGRKSRIEDYRLPALPAYTIQDIELANHDHSIRDYVILGFIPGHPDRIITLLNAARLDASRDSSRFTLCVWSFNPNTLLLTKLDDDWTVTTSQYSTLTRAASAHIGHTFVQVLCYCHDVEEGIGYIEVRHQLDSTKQPYGTGRIDNSHGDHSRGWFSTVEVNTANICFSKSNVYTTILLRTRCIFFFHDAWRDSPPCPYRSAESAHLQSDRGRAGFHIFELDIYIEKMMERHTFGHGEPSKWTYLTMFDTRPKEEQHAIVERAEKRRAHRLSLDSGLLLLVGVLADDHESLILLTLFIDPLTEDKDSLVLDARRWQLQNKTNRPLRAIRNAMTQIFHISADAHDCRRTCAADHELHDATVLATYETDGSASLDIVEGEYYNIIGSGWQGIRTD